MIFQRTALCLLLLSIFVMGQTACAQDDDGPMAPLKNYRPPPHMFDPEDKDDVRPTPAVLEESEDSEDSQGPTLTGFSPPKEEKPPAPPHKPTAPKPPKTEPVLSKPIDPEALKPFDPQEAMKYKPRQDKRFAPTRVIEPGRADMPWTKKPEKLKQVKAKPVVKDIDNGELVNPSATDILASIIGKADKTGKMCLTFKPNENLLSSNMKTTIINDFIPRFKDSPRQKIQIQTYATPTEDGDEGVKSVSLARAIEVRDFLIANGINQSRITLHPHATQAESGPKDRADIVLPEHK